MTAVVPRAHDHLIWTPPGIGEVDVIVTRVAADLSWADLLCTLGTRTWPKRERLPLRPSYKRKEAGVIFEEGTLW